MRNLIFFAVLILMLACNKPKPAGLPFFNSADFTPEWISNADPAYKNIHTVAPFQFYNQDGKVVTEKDVAGKIYVADFFFTKCSGICPKMTTNMARVAETFKADDIVLLSHSVTPETDSVATLRKYAQQKNISYKNWHLLTGDKDSIYQIARTGYFADRETGLAKDTTEFLHTENFILVDKQRRIRGIYDGTLEFEIDQLIKHIRILQAEE